MNHFSAEGQSLMFRLFPSMYIHPGNCTNVGQAANPHWGRKNSKEEYCCQNYTELEVNLSMKMWFL